MTNCNKFTAIDERSQRLGLPLPHPANNGLVDVMRLREAFEQIDERMVSRNDPTVIRKVCTDALTLYVRTDGNDNNDGLSETTAKATIQAAVDDLCHYDARNSAVYINIGPGSFAGALMHISADPSSSFNVVGAGEQTRIRDRGNGNSFQIYHNRTIAFHEMLVESRFNVCEDAYVLFNSPMFFEPDDNTNCLFYCRKGGQITTASDLTIRGGGRTLAQLCYVVSPGSTLWIGGTTVFESAAYTNILRALDGGTVVFSSQWSGGVTGVKYHIDGGGFLSCGNRDPDTYLPGDQPGVRYNCGIAGFNGLVRAYAYIDPNGKIIKSFNVASVTREAPGVYTIIFSRSVNIGAPVVAHCNASEYYASDMPCTAHGRLHSSGSGCTVETRLLSTGVRQNSIFTVVVV